MSEQKKTKADLQEENDILLAQNAVLQDKFSDLEKLVDSRIQTLQSQLEQSAHKGEPVTPEVEMFRDPYHNLHPHKILKNPPGKVLGWKGEHYRSKRGWRGWTAIAHDDEIGRNLAEYIADPPVKMEGGNEVDNYVRRGDSILSWIDEDTWVDRQRQRKVRDDARTGAAKGTINRTLMPGVTTFGEGVKTDPTHER